MIDISNSIGDFSSARMLWNLYYEEYERQRNIENTISTIDKRMKPINKYNKGSNIITNNLPLVTNNEIIAEEDFYRILHSYLRSFQIYNSTIQCDALDVLVNSTLQKLQVNIGNNISTRNINERTSDEIINAYLRCFGLPKTLSIALDKTFSNTYSESSITNMLIYYDRYWRSYNNENYPLKITDLEKYSTFIKNWKENFTSSIMYEKNIIDKNCHYMTVSDYVNMVKEKSGLDSRDIALEAKLMAFIVLQKAIMLKKRNQIHGMYIL